MTAAEFNPMATRAIETAEFPKDHNQPANDNVEPEVFTEINDLFDEAKNFADGEPIADEATAAAITKLYDGLHAAGKRADELRVAEKKPHDDAAAAVQARYNPFIQPKKGKVDLGKSALSDLLSVWRTAKSKAAAAEAALAAEKAAEATRIAQEAIRASSGNLAARVEAEELLAHAASVTKQAARADKAATTGTGLRTVWRAELVDAFAALTWYYDKNPGVFHEFIQKLADADVHSGVRKIEGFRVVEDKVATAGRARA
jgi:hypothetical protein